MTDARAHAAIVEILTTGNPPAQAHAAVVEFITIPAPPARAHAAVVEFLVTQPATKMWSVGAINF